MIKVVLDSNIIISSVGKKSLLRPIWESFIKGQYQIVISEDILKEYEEILQQHTNQAVAEIVMEIILNSVDVVVQKVYYNWQIISTDPDDNKFFDIAVAANVDYLVTNDHHFDVIKGLSFPKVNIINAEDFLNILSQP